MSHHPFQIYFSLFKHLSLFFFLFSDIFYLSYNPFPSSSAHFNHSIFSLFEHLSLFFFPFQTSFPLTTLAFSLHPISNTYFSSSNTFLVSSSSLVQHLPLLQHFSSFFITLQTYIFPSLNIFPPSYTLFKHLLSFLQHFSSLFKLHKTIQPLLTLSSSSLSHSISKKPSLIKHRNSPSLPLKYSYNNGMQWVPSEEPGTC